MADSRMCREMRQTKTFAPALAHDMLKELRKEVELIVKAEVLCTSNCSNCQRLLCDLARLLKEYSACELNTEQRNERHELIRDFLAELVRFKHLQQITHRRETLRLKNGGSRAQQIVLDESFFAKPEMCDQQSRILIRPSPVRTTFDIRHSIHVMNILEEENRELQELERRISFVHELFVDVSSLLKSQEAFLESLQRDTAHAAADVESARKTVTVAEHEKRTRRRKQIIAGLTVAGMTLAAAAIAVAPFAAFA